MKATIPISGVVKQSSNVRSGLSPIPGPPVSPLFSWRNRASPDHASGQRSPGSSSYKGRFSLSVLLLFMKYFFKLGISD